MKQYIVYYTVHNYEPSNNAMYDLIVYAENESEAYHNALRQLDLPVDIVHISQL